MTSRALGSTTQVRWKTTGSAEGIPEPEFELVGEHERVELDQRTRRQLMLKQPIPQDIDAAVTEEITVKAINRAGESEPVTFTLTIHPDE